MGHGFKMQLWYQDPEFLKMQRILDPDLQDWGGRNSSTCFSIKLHMCSVLFQWPRYFGKTIIYIKLIGVPEFLRKHFVKMMCMYHAGCMKPF